MELIAPTPEYKDSFIRAVKEYQADASTADRIAKYRELSVEELENDFDTYVANELSHASGKNLPLGYVPASEYWLVDAGEYIGRATVRHGLSERLLKIGGHIGYDIRPSRRGLGYGNEILRLALEKAKTVHHIQRALLTCDEDNEPSRKIIEKNGGVLENSVLDPETGKKKLRYWIDLA